MNERELREQICQIGQLMHRNGYIDGASGNISTRLSADRILATPSGLAKGFMTPDQLIIVNMEGERVDTPTAVNAHLRPTSELAMHLECYRQRSDVQGVVHAHPPTAVAMTIAGYDLGKCLIPEVVVILGIVPTVPYSTPASAENRDAIQGVIGQHDALMLAYHGSLTVATTVWDAYLRLESLEHAAKILYMVEQLGGPKHAIEPAQVEKLIAIRTKLGLSRPGDAERFYAACGVRPTGQSDDLERRVREAVREALAELYTP
ncbi:MAG: class II aldolase/adducin family protein [Anaerolineae bacterium]|nr:class II aldolase/adducin family protein [Anaerolineae bacterium]